MTPRLFASALARALAMAALLALTCGGLDYFDAVRESADRWPSFWAAARGNFFPGLVAGPLVVIERIAFKRARSLWAALLWAVLAAIVALPLLALAWSQSIYASERDFSRGWNGAFSTLRLFVSAPDVGASFCLPLALAFAMISFVQISGQRARLSWAMIVATSAAVMFFAPRERVPSPSALFMFTILGPAFARLADHITAPRLPAENLPPHLPARNGRDAYLAANGFTVEGYTAPTFTLKFFGLFTKTFPNLPSRQRVVPLHDLHHVITGYGTDYTGEAEIGMWELRAGCTSSTLYFLNGTAALIGLFIAPIRTLRAWRRARGARSLYTLDLAYDALLALTIGELRARTGVPAEGQADVAATLHSDAPRRRVRWPVET